MLSKRQEEIIEKSIQIIDEKGIQGLTIKNISKAIGISEPAIYRHFDSKFDILCTVLNGFKEDLMQRVQILEQDKSEPLIKMQNFYTQVLHRLANNPSLVSVIFSEEIFQNESRLAKKVMEIQQMNEEIVKGMLIKLKQAKQISESANIEMFTILFFGSMRQLVRQWKFSGHNFNLVEKGNILFSTLIQALKH
ncbi:MAG: TetR/AcrR family transcriptional regulator [Bacteroidales bacterium]|nr:TetR/AcrR family transcriptional regulator [Bacteroidales bacterium]